MKTYITTADAKKVNSITVDFGHGSNLDSQHFLSLCGESARYYNSGHLGHNYDVYDLNGITFLIGDRTPDMWHPLYDSKILHDVVSKLEENNNKNFASKDFGKIRDELVKVFTDSVHAGLRDPFDIDNFSQFKKELVYQKDTRKDLSFCSISKLLKPAISSTAVDLIDNSLGKEMEKAKRFYPKRFEGCKNKSDELEVCLGIVYEKEIEKSRAKAHQAEREGR